MITLSLELEEDTFSSIKKISQHDGISVEDYIKKAVVKNVNAYKPSESAQESPNDEDFNKAADYILKKNSELYKRLA